MGDGNPNYRVHSVSSPSRKHNRHHWDCRTWTNGPSRPECVRNNILQLNIEGISKDKIDYVSKLARDNQVEIILLQETHTATEEQLRQRGLIADFGETCLSQNDMVVARKDKEDRIQLY